MILQSAQSFIDYLLAPVSLAGASADLPNYILDSVMLILFNVSQETDLSSFIPVFLQNWSRFASLFMKNLEIRNPTSPIPLNTLRLVRALLRLLCSFSSVNKTKKSWITQVW